MIPLIVIITLLIVFSSIYFVKRSNSNNFIKIPGVVRFKRNSHYDEDYEVGDLVNLWANRRKLGNLRLYPKYSRGVDIGFIYNDSLYSKVVDLKKTHNLTCEIQAINSESVQVYLDLGSPKKQKIELGFLESVQKSYKPRKTKELRLWVEFDKDAELSSNLSVGLDLENNNSLKKIAKFYDEKNWDNPEPDLNETIWLEDNGIKFTTVNKTNEGDLKHFLRYYFSGYKFRVARKPGRKYTPNEYSESISEYFRIIPYKEEQ